MPRLDCFHADPRSYRSGFWGTVTIPAQARPGHVELTVEVRLEGGSTASAPIGRIAVVERERRPPDPRPPEAAGTPLIAICMATYNPDVELFRTQIESIRAQTYPDWICLISDDSSEPELFEAINDIVGGDARFVVSRAETRQGFYRNFERALQLAPAEAELVALSDQDDRWYPDKLEALRTAIGSAQLAYSDLRRVDEHGQVRAETLWKGRRRNDTNLASLLISNSIPGAACLFRRHTIDRALPFPDGPGWDFHDHWLAIVALALGDIAYVDRPLYDYVQHPHAVLGRVASGQEPPRPLDTFDRWRAAYFSLYLQREFLARALLARCDAELSARKRRALRLLVHAARSPLAFAWLASRPARALVGRNDTLMVEEALAKGIVWRHLIALRAGRRRQPGRLARDASMPPANPGAVEQRQRRWLAP
jgi:glycosyltransferase involved in cell wall biosynthesis